MLNFDFVYKNLPGDECSRRKMLSMLGNESSLRYENNSSCVLERFNLKVPAAKVVAGQSVTGLKTSRFELMSAGCLQFGQLCGRNPWQARR